MVLEVGVHNSRQTQNVQKPNKPRMVCRNRQHNELAVVHAQWATDASPSVSLVFLGEITSVLLMA